MKLLIDENLPPSLVAGLSDLFAGSAHVKNLDLGHAPDRLIWEFAKDHGYLFLTKDRDFINLSITLGPPPKVVLIQTGNCSTSRLESTIRTNAVRISDFEKDPKRAILILR